MNKNLPFVRTINIYIAKIFLIRFLQVSLIFCLLIFFINFLEALDKSSGSEASIFTVIAMAFLQIPDFLNDIVPSLVLFAAMMTFFFLSLKSEITVIRSCGFSLWHIISPIAIAAFLLGVFWTTAISPLSITMLKKFNALEGQYVKNEMREVVESQSGIWIKQANEENIKQEIVIQAKKVYKENIELNDATIWFFDENGQFYRKIDTEKMILKDGFWIMEKGILNDLKSLNVKIDEYKIATTLKPDFVIDKIVSNFQNVKLFSIFELPKLIESLKMAGFQSTKFEVYFNSLLAKPFLFVAMVLIACFFGINNFRNQNTALMIFFGIICGLALYISLSFIAALGSSRLLPVFASTWVTTFICLAIGILLIYKKESN